MKKKILYILLCFTNLCLYAAEKPDYIVTKKSCFYDYRYDHYEPIADLNVGKIIYLEKNWFLLFNELIYVSDNQTEGEIKIDIAIPANTKDLFDEQIISKSENNYEWLPVYYLDILKQQNGNILRTYEPDIPEIIDESDYGMDSWKRRFEINGYLKIYNMMLGIGYGNGCTNNMACDLNIINIEKKANGYDVTVANGLALQEYFSEKYSDWLYGKIPAYTDYTPYKILIRFDGDYLKLYLNELKNLIQIFFKAENSTQKEIEYLVKTGKCDLSKVTWPRHADGTCDYDGSSTAKKISLSSTNVSVNKLMSVSENLKLRSGEATSTQVLTVMSAGTKVKILELGKAETIDGINSNWVKVEVQSGAKDRDGKEIKTGTVGWCYGGYLK